MKPFLVFAEDTSRAFALLFVFVTAALVPPLSAPSTVGGLPGERPENYPALEVAAGVLVLSCLCDAARAGRVLRRGLRCSLRGPARLIPSRGYVGRWLHLSFREPLVPPDQARAALARLCGYRLHGESARIASLRPSIRRWRFGIWVIIARPSKASRHWECQFARWVEDPHEVWLLRSALQASERPGPALTLRARPLAIASMRAEEVDDLLRGTDAREDRDSPAPP
jgi:hypothetical protein